MDQMNQSSNHADLEIVSRLPLLVAERVNDGNSESGQIVGEFISDKLDFLIQNIVECLLDEGTIPEEWQTHVLLRLIDSEVLHPSESACLIRCVRDKLINSPQVGRDPEAMDLLKSSFNQSLQLIESRNLIPSLTINHQNNTERHIDDIPSTRRSSVSTAQFLDILLDDTITQKYCNIKYFITLATDNTPKVKLSITTLNGICEVLYLDYWERHDRETLGALIVFSRRLSAAMESSANEGRWEVLSDLGAHLLSRYSIYGQTEDLQEAMEVLREALSNCPGHSDKSRILSSLATSLSLQYQRTGDAEDLSESIALNREALGLRKQGHPDRASSLSNLAVSLRSRYEKLGEEKDLDESITLCREALQLQPQGHFYRSFSLNNLATFLGTRYAVCGELKDLDESIGLFREALPLRPHGHPNRPASLSNLAGSLKFRYQRFSELKDLEESIMLHREALRLRADGDPQLSSALSNLAVSLTTQYENVGDINYLEESVVLQREALRLRPHGHPERASSLSNLASSLQTRYEEQGEVNDLEEAITLLRDALQLRTRGHPNRSSSLDHLAVSMYSRYKGSGEIKDLEESIALHRAALQLQPQGHPDRATSLSRLANSLAVLEGQHPHYASEIQQLVSEAVDDNYTSTTVRLQIAKQWSAFSGMDLTFRLHMHRKTLSLAQQLLVINPDLSRQQEQLLAHNLGILAANAAATAITAGDIKEVVAVLDFGRSVFLSTLQRYRTPLDDLRAVDSGLADQLKAVGSQLENLAMLNEEPADRSVHATRLDHALNTQRSLIHQWDDLTSRIRNLPGLEEFLGMPSYRTLQAAARHGPVVFLNASESRCDAIIMPSSGEPTLLHLPKVSSTKLAELAELLERSRAPGSNPNKRQEHILYILRWLWDAAVSPVVEKLSSIGIKAKTRSRIWWCPTSWFTMLPIHAAGPYNSTASTLLPDLFISSYISTASNLIRSTTYRHAIDKTSITSMLFVGHANDDLDGVEDELNRIQQIQSVRMTSLVNTAATPTAVLEEMKLHPWIHLTCHGLAEHNGPLNSRFTLEGGDLHVQDIIKARLEKAEFAFLSSCHSAAGSRAIPDENLHLASALQFAGFRSVVGTMWEMYDNDGPALALDFYKGMVALGGRYDNAAAALRYAIKQLRKRTPNPERWAMFIHVGA